MFKELTDFIKTTEFSYIYNESADGRVNSSLNEDIVLDKLKAEFPDDIELPNIRCWYDFKYKGEPVNLKISNMKAPDNISSKKGMAYALTGIDGDEFSGSWDHFHEKLFNNLGKDKNADYYLLIVNSNNFNDCFCTSLKSINNLRSNGNNLPFQCNWSENREIVERTFEESKDYILSVYYESWKKKTSPFKKLQSKMEEEGEHE